MMREKGEQKQKAKVKTRDFCFCQYYTQKEIKVKSFISVKT